MSESLTTKTDSFFSASSYDTTKELLGSGCCINALDTGYKSRMHSPCRIHRCMDHLSLPHKICTAPDALRIRQNIPLPALRLHHARPSSLRYHSLAINRV